jgi:hypothetical protein
LVKKVAIWQPGYSIGIKHGTSLTGGEFHNSRLFRYTEDDNGLLASTVDPVSLALYEDIAASIPSIPSALLSYEGDRDFKLTT